MQILHELEAGITGVRGYEIGRDVRIRHGCGLPTATQMHTDLHGCGLPTADFY